FRIRLTDNTGVAGASFVLSGRSYRGDSIGLRRDTVLSPPPDSLDWLVSVPGYGLGSRLGYYALAGDILGSSDSTAVDSIIIVPRKGKAGLGDGTTDVGDLLRLVYLVLGLVEQPGLIDTLGLDLDRNGYFSTVDLLGLLDIWHQGEHSSAMLASAGRVDGSLAAGLLEGKEGERVFQVENSVFLPYGIVELETDPPAAAAALRLVPGNRLAGLPHLCQTSAESGSILLVFASPGGGKGLSPGSGGLFTVDNSEASPHRISVKRIHLGGREVTAGRDLGLARKVELPKSFSLDQNVPNPFNPSTTIRFALPVAQVPGGAHQVRLTVYNLRGQTVDNLLEGGLEPGYYNVVWNGTDRHGKPLPSGIYFYRLQVNERVFTRKMVLIK
ncbi:MAG: T9SS type A sorting domain-containing protein, partial [Candidatus Glassbacteria bacterium]|nr:T9SS type A sorting domain-containing protein [Candidatus Glassbacteria bacterium]